MLRPNPAYIEELMEIVNRSPFPERIRMRMAAIDVDRATMELDIEACHMQAFGIVHGGVLATLIDTATFWSVYFRLPADSGLVNIDLKLNYLKPATGGRLSAAARSIRSGNTLSYAEAHVTGSDGELIAHGTSTLMALPGKGLRLKAAKFLPESAP